MRWRTSFVLAAVGLLVSVPSAAPQSGTRIIFISALDGRQQPVPDLRAGEFVVKEDGRTRDVVEARIATEPVQVMFLLDDSGLGLGSIRQGAWEFVQALRGRGEFAITAIGSQNVPVLDFTSEPQSIYGALTRLLTRNSPPTYLVDAVLQASRALQRREAQRPIIVLVATEGQEFSSARPEDVLDAIQSSRARLYYIGLGRPDTEGYRPPYSAERANDSTEDEAIGRNVILGAAPDNSGGRSEHAYQTSGIPTLMRRFATEVAGQYAVTYRTDAARAKLGVETTRRGVKLRAPARVGER